MADKELVSHQQQFVEEINYDEIETEQVVGKGSFGVVWKGRWKGQYVAIKYINSEGEKKAFTIEVRQLSRVIHPNIVKLYGACTKNPVCLVMEYAEGGSLYNVLHCNPQPQYTAGHAMSWALQCARGVAYLHNMKPKPLIHRDLKPPNLLLVMGGQTLKICDFGTACDLNTYMTNNKGSAAWMAPEVFEGSKYTEKCDVFSWGVILWEILSRKKPFDEIGGSAYRIMWAVHIGQRPPLIEDCPKPLEDLMIRCWHKSPEERPSMDEVVEIMTTLSQFFNEHLEPVEYSRNIESEKVNENHVSKNDTLDVTDSMDSEINGYAANGTIKINVPASKENSEILNGRNSSSNSFCDFKNSSSKNNISSSIVSNKKFQIKDFPQLYVECDPNAWELPNSDPSLESSILKIKNTTQSNSTTDKDLDNVYRLLDADLRPLTPDQTCERSKEIFEEHKQLAQEYLKVQTEIALLGQHKNEMLKNLTIDSLRQQEELRKLEDEKESLIKLYRNLKRQLEIMKNQRINNVLLSNAQVDPTVSGNNGWFVVPCQNPPRHS
ncbi:mitogen-activated protein kinase kinase kinase 7 isoform X1 [Apis mellifera caucasica]|uniref:Mitogen-activated protein kinase kinase kinase 7 n=1 Tax=Apis mellifera TaxID=7460 RepID=A0A7M7R736_APIME|nr:mitogen-activated protein kinase kinase kinase 7 isoform X1 [Apis mellifera]KAG6794866.1 mitogen-activated protein kinase kinase kinase 7 isoform X1 [Apis mellifera caucasica]KAG9434215.1 mitogen-activated protein kinase kinase kinase 7 isoform X1 [Apis mellifera carnica]|eukprot:XP_397248.4 mitogen-activated protein kinase kinase kinase 7 isoform X1 [Apis mellifera]